MANIAINFILHFGRQRFRTGFKKFKISISDVLKSLNLPVSIPKFYEQKTRSRGNGRLF